MKRFDFTFFIPLWVDFFLKNHGIIGWALSKKGRRLEGAFKEKYVTDIPLAYFLKIDDVVKDWQPDWSIVMAFRDGIWFSFISDAKGVYLPIDTKEAHQVAAKANLLAKSVGNKLIYKKMKP